MEQQLNYFIQYLEQVRKSSRNTVLSYRRDLEKFLAFLDAQEISDFTSVNETTLNAYILMMGKNLKLASADAVLNANYIKEKLKGVYELPYDEPCMHEFVLSGEKQHHQGVSTLGIAKRLMDSNCHPPTVYFPLIVHEAIMIEPTESESKEVLDGFIDTMLKIAKEIEENPEEVLKSPQTTPIKKVDETLAARHPDLTYKR